MYILIYDMYSSICMWQIPFHISLDPSKGALSPHLYESFHGAYVNIQVTCAIMASVQCLTVYRTWTHVMFVNVHIASIAFCSCCMTIIRTIYVYWRLHFIDWFFRKLSLYMNNWNSWMLSHSTDQRTVKQCIYYCILHPTISSSFLWREIRVMHDIN